MPTEVEAELLEAARYGDDVPEMEEILAKGVDINCKDDSGKVRVADACVHISRLTPPSVRSP